jgi:hypothetical protein
MRKGESEERSLRVVVVSRTEEGVYSPKYANRRGDKSAKSPLNTLLSLLALPYSGDFKFAPGGAKIMPTVNKELHSKALIEFAKAAGVEKNKRVEKPRRLSRL